MAKATVPPATGNRGDPHRCGLNTEEQKLKKTVIMLATLLITSTAAYADMAYASHSLSDTMTEQEVINFLSNYPYKVSLKTCGSDTTEPWTCKILTFGRPGDQLDVLFHRRLDGVWEVNSWY